MAAPKQVDLTKAAALAKKRKNAIGPTVELRATARGQYGYPYAQLVERGTIFKMAIKDLPPFKGGKHPISGLEYTSIEYDGKTYGLPSWAVDASLPVEDEGEEEEDLAQTISGRPSRSTQTMDDDDVL